MAETTDDSLIAQLVANGDPGSFVTKWVVVAEFIDPEGERAVLCAGSDDLMRWETYGLLTEALQVEKAHHIAARLDE